MKEPVIASADDLAYARQHGDTDPEIVEGYARIQDANGAHFVAASLRLLSERLTTLDQLANLQRMDVDDLKVRLAASQAALIALRDAVKASGLMNGPEYVGLGIQVNNSINY